MASSKEGGKLMQEIYDQFLICKICYEAYKRPKTLTCLHIFCTECLEQHMDAEMERSYRYLLYSRMVTCPICRKKTEIPSGGIKRLPDNFLVTNLTQIMSRRRPNSKNPACEICKQSTQNYTFKEAVSKCLDCSKFLCPACVELHTRTKVTMTHSLIDVEDEKDIECKVHTDEVVRFYCEPCEMCICVLCTFQEHKGHEVSSFSEGLSKYRHSLDGLVGACRERVAALRERLDRITNCESVIRLAEEQIRDTAINSISAIRKKEKQMIQDLMNAFGEESLEFIKEKEPIQDALENLVSTCNLTDIILRDKGIELLLLKKEIQEKLQVLLNHDLIPTPQNLEKCVKFLPGKMVFGYLSVDSRPSTEASSISCLSTEAGVDDMQMSMYSSMLGCDVTMQTEGMTVEDRCTSIGGLFPYCDHDIFSTSTQTEQLLNGTVGDDELWCSRCLTLQKPELREANTMTESIEVVKRKVQTEPVAGSWAADVGRAQLPYSYHTRECATNTSSVGMCTRSTLTMQGTTHSQPTDTTGLICCHDKLCGTQTIIHSNSSTLTDTIDLYNKSTLTDTPTTADKLSGTTKLVQRDESSNTPVTICLDMGTTAKMEGENKAINTKTIVTMDSAAGDHVAEVQSCGSGTHEGGYQVCSVATNYDAVKYASRASSPLAPFTCDQSCNTTCTPTPDCTNQHSQTDISFHTDIIKPHISVTHQETNTDVEVMVVPPMIERRDSFTQYVSDAPVPKLCESSSNTESFETELVDVCVGPDAEERMSVSQVLDTSTSTARVELADVGCMCTGPETTSSFTNTSTITNSDVHCQVEPQQSHQATATYTELKHSTTNTPVITMQSRETGMEYIESVDKCTITAVPDIEEKGTNTRHVVSVNQDMCTELVVSRECGTLTYVATIEKATYMPQPVIISTGTSTPSVTQADKRTNTKQVETRDWASMTHLPKRTIDQGLNTIHIPTTATGTNTIKVWSTDRAVDAFHGNLVHACTLARPPTRDNFTEMQSTVVRNSGCNPIRQVLVESGTCMGSAHACDMSTSTLTPAIRHVATLKRPQVMTVGVETKRTKFIDNFTVMPTIVTQDSSSNTPGTVDIEKFNVVDKEKPRLMERAMQTMRAACEDRASSPVLVAFGEDKAVEVVAIMQERASSPCQLIGSHDKCIGHDITLSDRAASPVHTSSGQHKCIGVGPDMSERAASPVHISSGLDKGTSAVQSMCDSGTSTGDVWMVSASTMTRQMEMVGKACSPVRVMMVDRGSTPQPLLTQEQACMACVQTTVSQTETDTPALTDNFTSTIMMEKQDSYTCMPPTPPPAQLQHKQTCTPHLCMADKNVYTERVQTFHQHTWTDQLPSLDLISQGTSTEQVSVIDRHTSPPPSKQLVEKATSPVRIIRLDKGISVNRAELVAPVESFQRAGVMNKLITPGEQCNEPIFIPRLTAIREDSKESSSDDEGAARNRMLAELSQSSIVEMEQLWSTSANRRSTAATNTSTFTAHGSCQTSAILCRVETGTSTPPVEMEDKAISTESFVGNGKMAECISKLRSVTQRLESQSTFTSMSPASPPIYSKANISGQQSVSAPSSLSTSSSVSGSSGGAAITMVTTIHAGSKSAAGDNLGQTRMKSTPALLGSPIPGRKYDSQDEDIESPSLRRKARKQRLDMSQLLRSSSMTTPEHAATTSVPPYVLATPRLRTVFPQVIPNITDVLRKSPRPPRRRKSDSVKKSSSDERSMLSESSQSSHSSHSSPERLKEKLQKMPSTYEKTARKPKEKHTYRSRSEKHRDKMQRQGTVSSGESGEVTKYKSRSRDLTPPVSATAPTAPSRRPRKAQQPKLSRSQEMVHLLGFAEEEEEEDNSSSDSSKGTGRGTQ